MQKKLIALAVAGVFAAPAFAATANVDVYGQIDFSVNWVNADNGGNDDSDMVTGKSNNSRIGFKGTEDLGGGLSAIWQIETGFLQGDNNNGTGYDAGFRNTFVGLRSATLGTVLAGRYDTPYKLATGKLDIFADSVGDYNSIIGSKTGVFGAAGTAFDQRVDQTVAYISPNWSGLTLAAAYVGIQHNEALATHENRGAVSAMAVYDKGPLFASLAYEKHSGGAGASDNATDASGWKLGLGYTFGKTRIGGVYERTSETGNTTDDRNAWWLGGAHTMGNVVLKAAYGVRGDSKAGATDDGGSMWALGVDYNLSKRTRAYIAYASANDEAAGDVRLYGQGATGNNNDPSVISVGVRHTF